MNKKGDINQVFTYLLSTIIVLFVGFLVVKFVTGFTSDTENRFEVKFYDNFELIYNQVHKEWNSEKIQTFRLNSKIKEVCFMQNECSGTLGDSNKENTLSELQSTGDNIAIFDEVGIRSSSRVGEFFIEVDNTQVNCVCRKLTGSSLEILLRNQRNEVYLTILN